MHSHLNDVLLKPYVKNNPTIDNTQIILSKSHNDEL